MTYGIVVGARVEQRVGPTTYYGTVVAPDPNREESVWVRWDVPREAAGIGVRRRTTCRMQDLAPFPGTVRPDAV
jgi:hypothetical protein